MSYAHRTIVTFQSDAFNTEVRRDYFINECCYGDDLCNWLIERLSADGVQCDVQADQEDHGWYFNFMLGMERYCFVCSYRQGDETDPGMWIGWIERAVGFMASIFGGRDKEISVEAPAKIHKALASNPQITEIRWHSKKTFDRGDETAGAPQPSDS